MKFKYLLSLSLLLLSAAAFAQTDFRPGYVVNLRGDTLTGEIDYRGDIIMGKLCRFRNDFKEETKYTPTDITAYRFKDSKYYVSREVNGKTVFLEFLIKGKINIYYLRDLNGEHYYLEKDSVSLTEIPKDDGIRYVNDTKYVSKHTKHIGFLNYYMQDAPNFQSRIERISSPDHVELIKLAEEYHNTLCKDESCIIYEKKMPLVKVNVEVVGGATNYNYEEESILDKNYSVGGVLTHFWMPRTNEKIYFRTGILRTEIILPSNKSNVHLVLYKIPLQIEYIYPKGFIRPKIAGGIMLYRPFSALFSGMGGVELTLHKKMSLSLNYDLEFMPNKVIFIPERLFSQTMSAGLIYKF